MYFGYLGKDGKQTNDVSDIVTQEVTLLCYQYVELSGGRRPSIKQIQLMVQRCFEAALSGDPKYKWLGSKQ